MENNWHPITQLRPEPGKLVKVRDENKIPEYIGYIDGNMWRLYGCTPLNTPKVVCRVTEWKNIES